MDLTVGKYGVVIRSIADSPYSVNRNVFLVDVEGEDSWYYQGCLELDQEGQRDLKNEFEQEISN